MKNFDGCQKMKLTCATAMVISNLAVVFTGAIAWFASIRNVDGNGDGFKVYSSTLQNVSLVIHDVTKTNADETQYVFKNEASTATSISDYDKYKINVTPSALVLEFVFEISKECNIAIDAKTINGNWIVPTANGSQSEIINGYSQTTINNYLSNVCNISLASITVNEDGSDTSTATISNTDWCHFVSNESNVWNKESIIRIGNPLVTLENPSVFFLITYYEDSIRYLFDAYTGLLIDYVHYLSDVNFTVREAS